MTSTEASSSSSPGNNKPKYQQRRGVQFPWKLHELLEETEKNGDALIISWLPDGKAFKVHQKADFSKRIMPVFFNSSKHKTFQRSLNLWGFEKITAGPDKGACCHPCFVRGNPDLCHSMMRVKIKGGGAATANANNANGEQASKIAKATASTLSRDSSSSISISAHAASSRHPEDNTSSLLHYLTHPHPSAAPSSILSMTTSRPAVPSNNSMNNPNHQNHHNQSSAAPSVSDFIRSSAQGGRGGPDAAAIGHEARLLHELRMRNDALEAALASRTGAAATSVNVNVSTPFATAQAQATTPSSSSYEAAANLMHQMYHLGGGQGGGLDQYSLLPPPPRQRDPVYEAALAAAFASKIVQL